MRRCTADVLVAGVTDVNGPAGRVEQVQPCGHALGMQEGERAAIGACFDGYAHRHHAVGAAPGDLAVGPDLDSEQRGKLLERRAWPLPGEQRPEPLVDVGGFGVGKRDGEAVDDSPRTSALISTSAFSTSLGWLVPTA